MMRIRTVASAVALAIWVSNAGAQDTTKLLFGDTHLHTSYSLDAFLSKNQSADPDVAYRWASGVPVLHPLHKVRVQIGTPLDFLVVSDHAELMGVIRAIDEGTAEFEDLGLWGNLKRWYALHVLNNAIESDKSADLLNSLLPTPSSTTGGDPVADPANQAPANTLGDTLKIESNAWHEIVAAADRHNRPGEFTAFIGWEWSSIPTGANLHRVVFTPEHGNTARQFKPFGSDLSQYPEDLWQWLEDTHLRTGARFIAMPHNSNISKGYMYADTTLRGEPISAEYARRRMHWEPVSEITQFKGDSETHPSMSPEDEFADFETYGHYIQLKSEPYSPQPADYARSALRTGLELETRTGVNPFQFGMIGSTDAHSGLSSAEEDNFWGKFARDSRPGSKRSERIGDSGATGWSMAAAGLAAVWARENTREEIFAAFQRKEVYATTGTRLQVQVFGGWNFTEEALTAADFASRGYAAGVPMGGNLPPPADGTAQAPQMLVRVMKDPVGANLDRVQIVKGWFDAQDGQQERVYNVAWSDDRQLDSKGGLPAVGNTVDPLTGHYENSIGAEQLAALWTDPDFNQEQPAFYYVRVLEIPTPRHSLLDALALQIDPPAEGPATLQERAYSSPIWYTPQR